MWYWQHCQISHKNKQCKAHTRVYNRFFQYVRPFSHLLGSHRMSNVPRMLERLGSGCGSYGSPDRSACSNIKFSLEALSGQRQVWKFRPAVNFVLLEVFRAKLFWWIFGFHMNRQYRAKGPWLNTWAWEINTWSSNTIGQESGIYPVCFRFRVPQGSVNNLRWPPPTESLPSRICKLLAFVKHNLTSPASPFLYISSCHYIRFFARLLFL